MEMQEEIREIRQQLRAAMNGVTATSMREKGIFYRMNFGVSYPEIKVIARRHEPSVELASVLWREDVREFKILATLLQPADAFPSSEADRWVREIPYLEIAEHCARNLFALLPYRENLILDLMYDAEDVFARTIAFLVLTDLFKRDEKVSAPIRAVFLVECLRSVAWKGSYADMNERFAALQAMKYYGRLSERNARSILGGMEDFRDKWGDSTVWQEIYQELKSEFEYYRGKVLRLK